jgi:hypothetical protein
MKLQQLLEHHGLATNPFADEDAQTDAIFKEHCIASAYHPSWDKIYGNPTEPATAIVFGEKGAGKTALRLQIVQHLGRHNAQHPDRQVFVIQYDDLNPFLDRFAASRRFGRRHPQRLLAEWKLWDHMDAILSIGVTQLVDRVLTPDEPSAARVHHFPPSIRDRLNRHQARDLMLLAACYDQSLDEPSPQRWNRLRRQLRFRTWKRLAAPALGIAVTLVVAGALIAAAARFGQEQLAWLKTPWPYLALAAAWSPWLARQLKCLWQAQGIVRHVRVGNHQIGRLQGLLCRMPVSDVSGQPLPNQQRSDDRYELLMKLQNVLAALGFPGIVVLVDRVDEPHLINGDPQRMKALVWPLLDNKFLKHPGMGVKLLLPIELSYFVDREDPQFFQRARLDKQNLVPSLEWTGQALYDVATARLHACASAGRTPTLEELFEESVTEQRLIDAFRELRVPRHLFKFLHRLLVAHSAAYTSDRPQWKIPRETFESVLAVYLKDQDAVDRGLRAG